MLKKRSVQPCTCARILQQILAWVGYMATSLLKIDLPKQGRIYSFGEEGMQLVQPSKYFSVTIFRIRSIGSILACCYF